ncbi:MAG: Ig-like domain-containing protein [Gemmatimonadaceae bacterium]|nr:Ig-like domain-containing protein [Gemmatimonadaceae bacterium]
MRIVSGCQVAGRLRGALALALTLALNGCSGGDAPAPTPPTPVPNTLTVSLGVLSVTVGQGTTASASGQDQNGAGIATGSIVWSSSASAVATVDAGGVVTGLTPGQAQIIASAGSRQGQATITVQQAPVATVVVSPATATLEIGETRQLVASTLNAAGALLSGRTIVWTSSDSAKVRVSAAGLATAVAPGTVNLSASSEGKSGSTAIAATAIRVASLTIAALVAPIAPGQTAQLRAVATDSAGNTLTGRAISWRSQYTTIASVSDTGLVTAVSGGESTITASAFSKVGSAMVTVSRTNATQWTEVARLQGTANLSNGVSAVLRYADGSSLAVFSGPTWDAPRNQFSCMPIGYAAVRIASGPVLSTVTIVGTADVLHHNVATVGDFDGDGQPDLFFGNMGCDRTPYPGERNSVLFARGGGLLDASAALPPINASTHSTDAADVRGIGVSDIMVTIAGNFGCNQSLPTYVTNPRPSFTLGCPLTVGPYLLRSNRDGTFTYDANSLPDSVARAPNPPIPSWNWMFNSTLLDDVTGDGMPDLLLATAGNAPSAGVMYPNDGHGGFRTAPVRMPTGLFGAASTSVVKMRQWTFGGRHVVILSSVADLYQRSGLQFLEYVGGAFRDITSELMPTYGNSFYVQDFHVADLDLDGCPDLVLDEANPGPNDITVWVCRNGKFVPAPQPAARMGLHPVWIDGRPMLLSMQAPLGGVTPVATTVRLYDLR